MLKWRGIIMARRILTIGIILTFATMSAHATLMKVLKTKDLVKQADAIVIGECIEKETKWVAKHMETTITVKVDEYVKGDMGGEIKITQLGGEVDKPVPLIQSIPGMASFGVGEKVLLFIASPPPEMAAKTTDPDLPKRNPKSLIAGSAYIVGWHQGKYTVLTDPKTGEQKVGKRNISGTRVLPTKSLKKRMYSKNVITTGQGAQTVEEIVLPIDYSKMKSLESFKKEIKKYLAEQDNEE